MKQISTLFISFLLCLNLFAYDYLRVGDVRNSWWEQQGNISHVFVKVTPQGTFAKCELILDFDASELDFNPEDSLELEMDFILPDNAVVTDLWLWIYGQAEQADIHDRWTASLIYESIVQRRIDPAILTKNWGNNYNLKVFPLMLDMPRRVKIEYMVPVSSQSQMYFSVPLPVNIVRMSEQDPSVVNIYFEGGENYSSPLIYEMPEKTFAKQQHPELGLCEGVKLAGTLNNIESLNLRYTKKYNMMAASILKDEESGENFYEFSVVPSDLFNISGTKKAVFLIDFIEANSNISGEELLSQLRESILQSFSENDSINIMFSGMLTAKASNNWISCDSVTINKLFNALSPTFFNAYSNLPPLISDGIQFIKANGSEGNLVLLSSGNDKGSSEQANDLVTDILDLIGKDNIIIHVLNLEDYYQNYIGYYNGGQYYYGNEYLYIHLTQKTSGEYMSVMQQKGLYEMLMTTNSRLSGHLQNLMIQVEFENGYAYSIFNMNSANTITYFDSPIKQVGKFIGDLPMKINSYGQLQSGEVVENTTTIYEQQIDTENTSLSQIWASQYIKELLGMENSNLVMSSIIETSIEERVLCDYTAFLVLEPGFVPDIDIENMNEIFITDDMGWAMPTSTNDKELTENTLLNYPNPLSELTTISYNIANDGNVQMKLIDVTGNLIEVIIDEYQIAGDYTFVFNAENIPEGVYYYGLWVNNQLIQQNKMIIIK